MLLAIVLEVCTQIPFSIAKLKPMTNIEEQLKSFDEKFPDKETFISGHGFFGVKEFIRTALTAQANEFKKLAKEIELMPRAEGKDKAHHPEESEEEFYGYNMGYNVARMDIILRLNDILKALES